MRIENAYYQLSSITKLAEGDVFEFDDILYLKTNDITDNKITCVALEGGQINLFKENTLVFKRQAKVVIE